MTSNIVLSNTEYKTVGKRPIRHDGYDKVTGKAQYGADIQLPGLIWGKVLRSPHAHARILSIDTSKAEAHPDVAAVVTSADLPSQDDGMRSMSSGPDVNVKYTSNNILASEKVLYKGHAVAAIAATSQHQLTLVEDLILTDPGDGNVEPGAHSMAAASNKLGKRMQDHRRLIDADQAELDCAS